MKVKLGVIIVLLILAGIAGFIFGRFRLPTSAPSLGFHKSYNVSTQVYEQAFALVAGKQIKSDPRVAGILVNHHLLAAPFIAETMQTIATTDPVTVVLISPNHFFVGTGNAITSRYDWQTPYGILPADQKFIDQLSGVTVQEFAFDNEHGVTGIVPFIKKLLPNAKVVPIILKEGMPAERLTALAHNLQQVNHSNRVLIVGSVDFSHYLPSELMNLHDVLSEHVLKTFDFANIDRMEINSQATIRLLLTYMQAQGKTKFTVLNHSNSAELAQHDDLTSGTSYVTGYFTSGESVMDTHQSFLAVGKVDNVSQRQLSPIERLFNGTNQTLVQEDHILSPDDWIKLGVTTMQNRQNIIDQPLGPFEVISNPRLVHAHSIVSLAQIDSVTARQLIDAGADLVIGQGDEPGPIEIYHNRLIVYSLGQLAGESVVVGLDRNDSGITYTLAETKLVDGEVTFLPLDKSAILKAKNIYHFNY